MAELYNNPPPSGSHHPPPPPGSEDNEPRIDGDGQEVNALRFLGAGAPGPGAPVPPAPSITPVSSGVSQQSLPSQLSQQPPAPPQTPHQHQPPSQSIPPSSLMPQTPGGVSSYDPYSDPSGVGAGAYHPHPGAMQIPQGPMSGPYGMPGGPPGAPQGMMGGAPMMMMPSYGYGMYPSPYGYMPAAGPYQSAMAPQPQPQSSQTQFLAMLNVLRVNNPKYYREWYKKYTAHKRNPDRVPFPPIPQVPGFPQMGGQGGGPGSSQTLPTFGRSRKESSRSSVNGDASYSRGAHDSFADYSSLSHVPNTSSLSRRRPAHSGRASVNGDYKGAGGIPPEDDSDIDGAAAPDMSNWSFQGNASSIRHSTFNNQSFQQPPAGGHVHQGPGSGSDRDRPQTQSGRSSTIGESYRLQPGDVYGGGDQQDSLNRYDSGLYNYDDQQQQYQQREPSPIRRMTPMKFSTFHCIATMSPLGHMIRIKNSGTVLEFIKMKQFVGHLPEYREMESYPGPLTQISTHKNTVINFCKRKIKEARSNSAQLDRENYILLWEFLMLMLRQNGMVVGSDIAELLLTAVQQQHEQQKQLQTQQQLENLKIEEIQVRDTVEGSDGAGGSSSEDNKEEGEGESSGEDVEKHTHRKNKVPVVSPKHVDSLPSTSSGDLPKKDEKKLIEEFCEHLLYGHKKDALDFAMDNGLWGHALFFASKMDERSYGHVLARFANGIPLNSPLQTLYHIMCGKQPASVTSCGDVGLLTAAAGEDEETKTFGDWKPHLAMLLSNSGYKQEVEQRAILTLGDTLQSKSHWFAAQFCFLMGHEEFRKDSRLGPLLGYSHQRKNILEATQMTEVYEFARKLADPGFSLGVSFLQSKLDYAKRLVSYGFVEEALAYCEEITKVLRQSGRKLGGGGEDHQPEELITLCGNTLKIAERIAVADESGTANGTWVEELRKMAQEPALFEQDGSRKLSLVSSTNQELQSDQMSHTSSNNQYQQQLQQQPQPLENPNMYYLYGAGGESSTQAPADVNMQQSYSDGGVMTGGQPEMGTQVQLQNNQNQTQGDIMQQQQQQQDNQWGQGQSGSMMMNGGLHLSQPPQLSPPQQQQQQQQQNMQDPPQQIPMMNNPPPLQQNYGLGDGGGGGYQQQPGGMDTGYSSSAGGYGDKLSTAAPTINNNSWYNPYDSQPSLGGISSGGGGGGNDHLHHQNSSPVKKKSVRFEDQRHQDGEGNNSLGDGGGGVVESIVRSRIGGNRPTSLDLKSALKSSSISTSSVLERRHQHYRERQTSSNLVNGGDGEDDPDSPIIDLEGCSSKAGQDKSQYFEVEYKSTYPIDEPIFQQSPPLSLRSPPTKLPPLQVGLSSRLVNSKSLDFPTLNHPYPHHQQQQLISNNHHKNNSSLATSIASSSSSSTSSISRAHRGGKTFQIDKECCDVSQPCEDHGDYLDDLDEEEEEMEDLLDEDEVDEEGSLGGDGGGVRVGKLNSNDLEGVENGGYHHRHQYARFENKTESTKPPAPSPNDKKPAAADKKKSGKDPKGGLDGGQQQDGGWFSGFFKKLKPKNQMILPDDKNPTIVWDPKANRWVNTAGDGDDDSAPAGPPPKDSELMGGGPPKGPGAGGGPPPPMMSNGPQQPMMMPPQQQNQQNQVPMMMGGGQGQGPRGPQYGYQQQQPQQPQHQQQQNKSLPIANPSLQQNHQQGMMQTGGGSGGGGPADNNQMMSGGGGGGGMPSLPSLNNNNTMNKYKLQKGRGMKGYVDVLNPNATSPTAAAPTPMQPNHHQQGGGGGPVPNLFIPPPMPQGVDAGDGGPVSFLTAPAPAMEDNGQPGQENALGQAQPPPMFNPAHYQGYPQGQ